MTLSAICNHYNSILLKVHPTVKQLDADKLLAASPRGTTLDQVKL